MTFSTDEEKSPQLILQKNKRAEEGLLKNPKRSQLFVLFLLKLAAFRYRKQPQTRYLLLMPAWEGA